MINIHDLKISFSGEELFSEATFRLQEGDRIGLVGKNGAGKSTLLKLIAGKITPDSGSISFDKDIKIGFLTQDIEFDQGSSLLEEAYKAFEQIRKIEKRIEEINQALVERTDYESASYHQLMVDLNELQHQYEIIGGYRYQAETEKILKGLGFRISDFPKKTETFSGGWRMRIELAKLLLQNNDVLLLDEPTNHLDIGSILWLEDFLKTYPGCVVLVSHDKMFLDQITNRTIEISFGKLYDYPQPYLRYLELRKERRAQQLAAQKNQLKEIEHTEKLIDKFRAKASKASMAQSLIKKLDRLERIEVDDEDLTTMSLRFPVSNRPGKVVLEMENISKSFGNKKVLDRINLTINREEKIAFVGQNGQGKSTLAKIIVGELKHDGHLKLGHNVEIGYFAQNQAEYLDGEQTILESMEEAATEENRKNIRDVLGAFLFRGDDVYKYVKVLSGGERNRLALAKLLLQPFNFLVMDEPTNHLDIHSKNVLKEALKKYEGTLLLVSHDRDFLQSLTSVIYEFKDQHLKQYLGDIDFYLEQRQLENMRQVEEVTPAAPQKTSSENQGKNNYEKQKALKRLKNRINTLEKEITQLEKKIEEKDLALALDYEKTSSEPSFFEKYQGDKKKLSELLTHWEDLHEEYEEKSNR